jgi:predicted nucleic acid-binding protein
MADRGVLIDTSVIIDFLRKKNKQNSTLWKLKEKHDCFMSAITLFELFAGATDDQKLEDVCKVAKWIEPILFDDPIAELSGKIYRELRHQKQLVEFRDIFIGATAIHYDYQLATLNQKHFNRIKSLKLIDV